MKEKGGVRGSLVVWVGEVGEKEEKRRKNK